MTTGLTATLDPQGLTICPARRVRASVRRPRRRGTRLLRRLAARGAAVAATVLLAVGLLALLVAEYGLLYRVVLAPWLQAVAPAGS